MPPRDALIRHMMDELENLGKNMTAWEIRFLENLSAAWVKDGELTDDQFRKLKQIYEERV